MDAILLAAGRGSRMAKYFSTPKQLLTVNGKVVIDHVIDALPAFVREIIVVVGGPHETVIREHFHKRGLRGQPIRFTRQEEQLGLAHAFTSARHLVSGRWIGMVTDDIFDKSSLEETAKEPLALLATRVKNPETFGVLVANEEGHLTHAVEKPPSFVSDLVWTGAMVMDTDFFRMDIEKSARGEYETADVWMRLVKDRGAKIKVVETENWHPINDKWQLLQARKQLKK